MTVLIIVGVIAVLVLFVVFWLWRTYNGLITARVRVKEAWSGIDVQLQRRLSLIPNLIQTVEAYAVHERETLDSVTRARSMLQSAGTPEQAAQADNMLTGALRSLFAVSENYPDLKANQNFMELQRELTDTEDKIAYARQFYNTNVSTYNINIQQFPTVVIANSFGFQPSEFFDAPDEAAQDIEVSFSRITG